MRPKVVVIGAGSWGTTLACMCARHGRTMIWALEDSIVEEINARHSNSVYLKGFGLPTALRATRSMEDATDQAETVIMAVPSPYFGACWSKSRASCGIRHPL